MDQIKLEIQTLCNELIEGAKLTKGSILVLGCSTSEIMGGSIGKSPNEEAGHIVVQSVLSVVSERDVYLAVQGCEHINRALVVEQEVAHRYHLEVVNVVPSKHAGGSCCAAAYELFKAPVMVEHISAHAGIDIGDTAIGMHVKFVQVPFRSSIKAVGQAHVSCLRSRPKYIGGARASYQS